WVERVAIVIGIDAAGGLVRGKCVGRLTAAGGNLFQLRQLAGCAAADRLIAVFDGPHVVWAERGGIVVPLLPALGHDVGRVVVHDGGDEAAFALFGVVHVLEALPLAALEVVPQAER